MNRLTQISGGTYNVKNTEDAIDQLARYENFHEEIINDFENCQKIMTELKAEGKEKTTKFKEQLGLKLMYQNILIKLKYSGLE